MLAEVLPLVFYASVPATSVWIYRSVFRHDLLLPFSPGNDRSLNELIRTANDTLGCHLLPLEEKEVVLAPKLTISPVHQNHIHLVVGLLFLLVCSLSVHLAVALMVQLAGATLELSLFKFLISVLVVLVAIFQPLLIISLYVNQDLAPPLDATALPKWVATAILFGFWLYMTRWVGLMAQLLDAGTEGGRSFMQKKTNEIVLVGVALTAVLSGIACTLTPWKWWNDRKTQLVTENAVNELIRSYNSTRRLARKRQAELDEMTAGTTYTPPLNFKRGKQLLNKVQSFASLSTFIAGSEERQLQLEIDSLKNLSDSLLSETSKKLEVFLRQNSQSPYQSLESLLYVCFSVYCLYRVVNVCFVRLPYHLWFKLDELHEATNVIDTKEISSEAVNKNTKDALAITIAKVIQLFGILPLLETQLINQVGFVLSGLLFACSFQNVLTTIKSFGRLLPTATTTVSLRAKSWIRHLVVSEFTAIYVVATALMIRSNLPQDVSSLLQKILLLTTRDAALETEFIDTLFDKVFAATAVGTVAVLVGKSFMEVEFDEEAMIESKTA